MSETPPPRDPGPDAEPDPTDRPRTRLIVAGDWAVRPEGQVVVEQTETETVPPRRRR